MNLEFSLISGLMLGFEYAEDGMDQYVVLDLFLLRILVSW